MEKKGVNLDITQFVSRLVEVNRIASEYEYEKIYEKPTEDAIKEILSVLDQKIGQWEWELKYDISKRGESQEGEDLEKEVKKKQDFVGLKFL